MKPITYKFVMDYKGHIAGIELWQNNQYITITTTGGNQHKNGHNWNEVKEFLDNIILPYFNAPDAVTESIKKQWEENTREA